ncbi:SLATT domain-containing protein [Muricauda sp. SCSIO 64092]|uniref:SLATT domain-containing protein n=1 Tax=Allomuricauda sp. SCSIO 64092 TaxID=2908842 RepID=UPI001FF4F748|nr:SLATT domain-containing protein [Muricauda sp. SCSIO 64092]UOY06572.1 SLATT domain-containing protein [Muricauda sp. SCSIO 64092]
MNKKLLATVRFYFAQCVFMNSIHYKAYNRLKGVQERNRNIVLGIASTTLILIILQIIGLEFEYENLLSVLSFCGIVLTGASLILELYNKEDISEIKSQHRNIGEEYKILRDQFISLIEEIMSSISSEEELRMKFKKLQNLYSQIGRYSPTTTGTDYSEAQSGLGLGKNDNEEFTWSNEEIDRFLPVELRIS